jgi:ribonuclease P protein component
VLAAANRLSDRRDFLLAARRGHRSGRECLTLQLVPGQLVPGCAGGAAPRVGFVVGRSVGSAVVRNRVKRQLRHLVRAHLERLPAGGVLVVRANPAAAGSSWDTLTAEFDRSLGRVLRRAGGTT